MKQIVSLLLVLSLTGCAISQKVGVLEDKPRLPKNEMIKELDSVPPPANGRLTVAVYSFADKTGQRKSVPGIASFSTAVTQGGDALLIRALQDVGHGTWFDVVERGNIDALTKERLIITQMRQAYEGQNAQKLMPLQFAGMIIEGGIIGYDTGLESGGVGYNFLGIGPTTQYSKDVITISLRAISVNTGKILAAVTITKTVYSTADAIAIFKSIDPGSLSSMIKQIGAPNTGSTSGVAGIFQFESGITINEATTIALKAAVESAVVELIKEGQRKGIWDYKFPMTPEKPWWDMSKNDPMPVPLATAEVKKEPEGKETAKPETKSEIPVDTGIRYLKDATYLYAKPDEAQQRRWQLKPGTRVEVKEYPNGWFFADDGAGHKGYVRSTDVVIGTTTKSTDIVPLTPSKKVEVSADVAAKEGVVK